MALDPGTHIGQYEIRAAIGSGGMGEVYRAHDSRLGRDVAIKILPRRMQQDQDALARFEREARAVSSLNHPHILTIHEISKARLKGERFATPFIVMEFIDGETLRARFRRDINLRMHLEQLAQVADALAKAHGAGIVHRDLKPENIMVNNDGYAKVLDFGLAKLVERPAGLEEDDVTARFRTSEGLIIGTSGYMSPEQVHGRNVDLRSDVFAFGCILYETVCGQRAFDASTNIEVLYRILHADPPNPPVTLPVELRDLISGCLRKEPAERWQSMRDAAECLRRVARDLDQMAPSRRDESKSGRTSVRARSIAVLPFENAGDDPRMEYLSDGLTETIIHNLSQVRRLRVMARTTVFTYKGRDITPQQVGSELSVRSVVTGKVQQIGGYLVVNIELVNTRDGVQIWGERYKKPFADILAIQEEISTQISSKLKIELTGSERRRLARRPTRKSAAFELYLKGRYWGARRVPDALQRAIECFELAIESDSRFALAYSGLAEAHFILAAKSFVAPEQGYPKVEALARKAIALDPALAEPHATLGVLQCLYKLNWKEAEEELLEAIRLDPSYPSSYHRYSAFLTMRGQHKEAIANALTALDLDPLSMLINVHLADTYHFAGQYDEAIERCRRVIELEPYYVWSYLVLGRAYDAKGEYENAVAAILKGIEATGRIPELLAGLGNAYAKMGRRADAEGILNELRSLSATQFVSHHFIAEVLIGLGDLEGALKELEIYFRDPSGELTEVLVGPKFAEIRKDPRYAALARELKVAPVETGVPVKRRKAAPKKAGKGRSPSRRGATRSVR